MDNLKYPNEYFLINKVSDGDFVAKATNSILTGGETGHNFNKNTATLNVSYTNLGHNNGYFLGLNTAPVINDGVYDFGFSVKRKELYPGIMNKYPDNHIYARPYFAEMNGVSLSSGVLLLADKEAALDTLTAMVLQDKSSEADFFIAKKAYKMTWTTGAVGVATVNGVVLTAAAATAVSFVAKLNDAAGVEAYLDGAATLIVTTTTSGLPLTVVAGSHTSVDDMGMLVMSINPSAKAIVTVDVKTFVPALFSLVQYDYSGIGSTADGAFDLNYIKADKTIGIKVVAVASSGAGITALNTADIGVYGSVDGDLLNIVNRKGSLLTARSITYPYTSELVAVYNSINTGVSPTNTADDLFRLFAGLYNGMGSAVRQNQTIEGAEYVLLSFVVSGASPGLSSGASSYESFKTRVTLVILKDLLENTYDGATLAATINTVFTGAIS